MCNLKRFGLEFLCICAATLSSLEAAEPSVATGPGTDARIAFDAPKPTLWENGVGEGFRSSVQTLSVEAGAVQGIAVLGGMQSHDLALLSVSYGHMLGHTVGVGHFYQGNWELRGELFGGSQFAPTSDWVIGLTPHLRYNFATGTRLVPYLDGGAGVTATSIGPPDLSNTFEFNLQATLGTHWFIRDNLALTLEVRYFHMSCAGISDPNLGLNGVMGMIGLGFFF
jgi:lipid A 3-O-deacylase